MLMCTTYEQYMNPCIIGIMDLILQMVLVQTLFTCIGSGNR